MSKAAGPDDIDPEHLRFGGPHLVSVLLPHPPGFSPRPGYSNPEGPQQGPIKPLQLQGDNHSVECEQAAIEVGDLEDQQA